jgi:hypothetical protein
MRAAIPATCGPAIEVPLKEAYPPVMYVLEIDVPGAAISTEDTP